MDTTGTKGAEVGEIVRVAGKEATEAGRSWVCVDNGRRLELGDAQSGANPTDA